MGPPLRGDRWAAAGGISPLAALGGRKGRLRPSMPDGATAEAPTIVNLSSRGAGARRNRSERRLDRSQRPHHRTSSQSRFSRFVCRRRIFSGGQGHSTCLQAVSRSKQTNLLSAAAQPGTTTRIPAKNVLLEYPARRARVAPLAARATSHTVAARGPSWNRPSARAPRVAPTMDCAAPRARCR